MTTDIDAIRQRAQAATPGPWTANTTYPHTVWQGSKYDEDPGMISTSLAHEVVADAEFIAHARTDVPALLAKVDELTAERDHMELNPTGTAHWLKHLVAELTAKLTKTEDQLTAANRRNDGLQADLDSATKANTAWANESAAKDAVIDAAKRVTATWRFHACIPTADLELTIGEEERKLAEAVDSLPTEIAPNGCDDCSVEPGERHRYFRCPGNGKALLQAEVAR